MLAAARRVTELDAAVRRGDWVRLPGPSLWHKKLGIVGTGRIGKKVAEVTRGFDMKLLAYDVNPDRQFAKDMNVTYFDSLEEMLGEADFITIHTPLTPDTKDLIGAKQFAAMKPGAILINCARGGIVNEQALYEALKNKTIAGAGIDVFAQEPVSPQNTLLTLDNLVVSTHNAGTSLEGKNSVVKAAVCNVIEYSLGLRPNGIINPKVIDSHAAERISHGK
jgi:D-3-phosphoglycerate dehydrogenase